MTANPLERAHDATADRSFEVELDEQPPTQHAPVYVDVVTRDHEVRPIVPASLRGWSNIKDTVTYHAQRTARIAGYHATRAPLLYLPLTLFWAFVGVVLVISRALKWATAEEGNYQLRQEAANRNDPSEWRKLDLVRERHARWRWWVVAAAGLAVVAAAGVLSAPVTPWWVRVAALLVTVPLLARAGRPADRPIITPAVVTPRYRKLNADIVLRAYYAAGLGRPDKDDQQIHFGSTMARVGDKGSQVVIDLPYGKTFADAAKAKAAIASGLDVTEQQVFLTRDKTSTRRHTLYVADVDPLAIPAGRTPLLDCKPRDIWQPAPFGLDERGRKVDILLMWISVLVGAQPRKGKTFSARLLALYAALDPYVRLTVVDGKNSPDWDKFRLVAHRAIFGTHPNPRSADPIAELLDALEEIAEHIRKVNEFLSKLPVSECPEGKLTRELSRKYPQLRVWLLVMEEFQVYYETDDQETNKRIAALLSFIMAVGPSAGVIILSSSQKPSGVGAGDVQRLFNRYRDNHAVRFALKCGSRDVSIAVLGGDAYQEGYDASAIPVGDEYRGVGILYGYSDHTPMVRTYLAEGPDAEKILLAARRHREAAGTLTGMAAGEDMAREVRDVLRDVRNVYYAGEAWISWAALASRLAEQMPEHYADITQEAISAQVRALRVEPKKGKQNGASLWGVPLAEVEQAIKRREIEAGR